ncbi:P1 family peptidase [Saccharothrix obliqua]|uniref:P1 family peptidase n=1 Tax=Saccharothrix obliqua TaxID=2861747 RepID=UPI001C5E4E9D|nr:P1 family peptidase [Saccharothrix obliqua]MBW4717711.1 P1 family peptidase [Saccharothrix obliqua]
MRNAITDVPGVLVGHATRIGGGALTGVTAVLLPPGTTCAVDVRGGAPATRDTAALDARHGGREARGLLLTGGSAYGLAAADGAARVLGTPVPAAALFDLGRGGDFHAHPTPDLGAEAVRAAGSEVAQGNVGAGTGALNAALKGGTGTASAALGGGVVVGAIAALNAAGRSVDPVTGLPFAAPLGLPGEFPAAAGDDLAKPLPVFRRPFNTVIGVVATNARLPATYALAAAGQDGLALAVRPAHGLPDGDAVFAASTGTHDAPTGTVLAAARHVFARALAHGLFAAESVTTPWGHLTAYREHYPRTGANYPTAARTRFADGTEM